MQPQESPNGYQDKEQLDKCLLIDISATSKQKVQPKK
jgi:hypothetical protein